MKDSVTKFDFDDAFKALDELEIPVAEKGIRANRIDLKESMKKVDKFELLFEDFYDVNNVDDMNTVSEEREAEVAKAKLARIEKIVDLDAETEEDILPSYVGKTIIQCPQCMTLFYKNAEDIVRDEENPDVVNVNEVCQHCGNESGYDVVGKVAEETEAAPDDELGTDDFSAEVGDNENDIAIDDGSETTEEAPAEESGEVDELSAEADLDSLDLDTDLEEEPVEEEEANESLHTSKLLKKIEDKNDLKTEHESEKLTLNEDVVEKETDQVCSVIANGEEDYEYFTGTEEECRAWIEEQNKTEAGKLRKWSVKKSAHVPVIESVEPVEEEEANESLNTSELLKEIEDKNELKTEHESEKLTLNENVITETLELESSSKQLNDFATAIHKAFEAKNLNNIGVSTAASKCKWGSGGHIMITSSDNETDRNAEILKQFALKVLEKAGAKAEIAKIERANGATFIILDNISVAQAATAQVAAPAQQAALKEGIEDNLDDKLKAHEEYIKELRDTISELEKKLASTKNEQIKTSIQSRIDTTRAELEAALPEAVKVEAETEELPDATEAGMEDATDNTSDETEATNDKTKETTESLTEDVSMASSPENFKTLLGTNEFKEPISQEEVESFFEEVKVVDNEKYCVDYRPAFEAIAKEVDGKFDFAVNFNVYNEKIVVETTSAIQKDDLSKLLDAMTKSKVCKENNWEAVYTGLEDNKDTMIKVQFKLVQPEALLAEDTENTDKTTDENNKEPAEVKPEVEAEVKVTAEIDKNITEEDVKKLTEVTEIDDTSFTKVITESLKEVYENVESFTLTDCSLVDNKLILEGLVAFKSTKTRPTTYVFEAQELDKTINLVGTNSELFESCEINLATTIIKESLYATELTYKYSVQGNLLEGLIRN